MSFIFVVSTYIKNLKRYITHNTSNIQTNCNNLFLKKTKTKQTSLGFIQWLHFECTFSIYIKLDIYIQSIIYTDVTCSL